MHDNARAYTTNEITITTKAQNSPVCHTKQQSRIQRNCEEKMGDSRESPWNAGTQTETQSEGDRQVWDTQTTQKIRESDE